MKAVLNAAILLIAAITTTQATQCHVSPVKVPDAWVTMQQPCVEHTRQQVQREVAASLQYLAMAAHFSRDSVNRPGFAELFFNSADEEREHAIKLIEYLLMRGDLTDKVSSLIEVRRSERGEWEGGVDALEHALALETHVTKSIRSLIATCEGDKHFNDYHLVDYLTGEFLQEQYESQRDFAGKVSNLKKIHAGSALGEFIFDKKLQGIDI